MKYITILNDCCGVNHIFLPLYFDSFETAREAMFKKMEVNPRLRLDGHATENRWRVFEMVSVSAGNGDGREEAPYECICAIEGVEPSGNLSDGQTMYAVIGKENEAPVLSKGFPAKGDALAVLKSRNPKAANIFDDEWAAPDPELELTLRYIVGAFVHAPKELL